MPGTSDGVWTPLPEGTFDCWEGLVLGRLEVDLRANPIGYNMSYYDLAGVIKMLHLKFVEQRSRSFEFQIRAQRDGVGDWAPVMKGAWRQNLQLPNNPQLGSSQSGGVDTAK